MDDDGFRNWGYYDYRGLNLQLGAERDTKSFIGGRDHTHMVGANGFHPRVGANGFHPRDCVVSEPPMHLDYTRDSWMTPRERLFNQMLPGNPHYAVLPEPSGTHHMQLMPPADPPKEMRMGVEDPGMRKEGGTTRKRSSSVTATSKTPKPKKPKKGPSLPRENGNSSGHRLKPPKKSMDVVINGIDMDISHIPIPVCSCTGTPQPCYRWGCGGWQSACCTTTISIYPLPMSTKRRGARIAGRKMSQGAFKKVLEKLAAEGYNFDNPIDLRTHWAKHGTNKFVTIK